MNRFRLSLRNSASFSGVSPMFLAWYRPVIGILSGSISSRMTQSHVLTGTVVSGTV